MGEWQPIETAPKTLDVVLLYEPPHGVGQGHRTLDGMRNANGWHWVFQVTKHGCEPTHWMPLPHPPR
jgi:hypothetical protein